MEENRTLRKWVYTGIGIILLIIIISVIFIIIGLRKSAKLELLVTPISSEVLVDGRKYENGTYDFEPGEINIVMKKEGFTTEERNVVLSEGSVTKVYVYLMPEDGSFDWYLEHKEDMMVLNTIGDAAANEKGKSYLEKYPIVTFLPMIYANYDKEWNYTEYRIDGGMFDGCETSFCLKVTDTTGGNLENAKKLIEEKGFSPDDYEIIYEYKPVVPLK